MSSVNFVLLLLDKCSAQSLVKGFLPTVPRPAERWHRWWGDWWNGETMELRYRWHAARHMLPKPVRSHTHSGWLKAIFHTNQVRQLSPDCEVTGANFLRAMMPILRQLGESHIIIHNWRYVALVVVLW